MYYTTTHLGYNKYNVDKNKLIIQVLSINLTQCYGG